MPKILIVEDNEGIVSFLKSELELEDFETCVALDGRSALEIFADEKPDLVLLDIMLPGLSGIEVLRRIRKHDEDTPVILVTARDGTDDKVTGLNLGSDDYITKPFKIEELLARINAVLRRAEKVRKAKEALENAGENPSGDKKNGELVLKTGAMEFFVADKKIELSKTEYLLLNFFMENIGTVLDRDTLLDKVWGKNHATNPNNLDIFISTLRKKIREHSDFEYITTVRGVGFKMEKAD
ncbi:MAG: response regulator transcription factor [Treponema sp.]|nr:response regulator transcription factor [Treponema sp.]